MRKPIIEQLRQALAQAERRGMTRYRISQDAGITPVMLTRLARGETRPRLDIAEKIAKAIGYDLTLTRRR
ncbi:MAG: helix-turn-helix domain-containing protein [Phycisphaeraceae bacterium]